MARGGEFCCHDALWRELPADLVRRFTHRIGSLHAVHIPGAGRPLSMSFARVPERPDRRAYMDPPPSRSSSGLPPEMPVDILAHPTLLPLPIRTLPVDELWTEALEERLVNALFDAGIAFEISNRYRPHERLVQRAHDRGVQLSLGSDGHTRAQVGDLACHRAGPTRLGACGIAFSSIPLVHGSRADLR